MSIFSMNGIKSCLNRRMSDLKFEKLCFFFQKKIFNFFFLSLENVKIRRHFAHRHLGLEFDKRLEEWVRLVEVNFELCHYRSKIILTLIGIVLSSCDCLIGSRGAGSVQQCIFELCFALDKLNQLG